jgi:hypothetical protein
LRTPARWGLRVCHQLDGLDAHAEAGAVDVTGELLSGTLGHDDRVGSVAGVAHAFAPPPACGER